MPLNRSEWRKAKTALSGNVFRKNLSLRTANPANGIPANPVILIFLPIWTVELICSIREITDEKTLNWFYENFNNLEISYKEEPTSDENDAFRNDKALYVLIECKDAGLSLMVNTDKKLLLVSENTTMSSENIKSPPAGIYSVQSEFDFDSFWNAYRKQRVPEST